MRTIWIRSIISHGKDIRPIMFKFKIFIFKQPSLINRFTSPSIFENNISPLDHILCHPMKIRIFITQEPPRDLTNKLFPLANFFKILDRIRHIISKKTKHNPAFELIFYFNIKKTFYCYFCLCFICPVIRSIRKYFSLLWRFWHLDKENYYCKDCQD